MSKLVTSTFAIVGVFTGFVAGIFLAAGVFNLHDGDKTMAMAIAFSVAIGFAALFGWSAGKLRDSLGGWQREALGGVGVVLAVVCFVVFLRSFT